MRERSTRPSDAPLHDPTALARFGNLDLVAKLVVEGYVMGQHKSPYKGSSIEFVEHRQYYPGDEIRHIDWRAYGKTGRYYIKEYEDETNLRCYMIVDCSGSMGYGESTISKSDYARQLAASLGYLLFTQRDAAGLYTFDTQIRDQLEPSTNTHTFQRITEALEKRKPGNETSLANVFETIVPQMKRRSLITIFSDCFDRIEPLMTALKMFRHHRHEVISVPDHHARRRIIPFQQADSVSQSGKPQSSQTGRSAPITQDLSRTISKVPGRTHHRMRCDWRRLPQNRHRSTLSGGIGSLSGCSIPVSVSSVGGSVSLIE